MLLQYYKLHTMSTQSEHEIPESIENEDTRSRVSLTISKAILNTGKRLAKRDNRSLSNYLETLILEKSGQLEKKEGHA